MARLSFQKYCELFGILKAEVEGIKKGIDPQNSKRGDGRMDDLIDFFGFIDDFNDSHNIIVMMYN